MKNFNVLRSFCIVLLVVYMLTFVLCAQAVLLTDTQLYFDFTTLADGYYESFYLTDLTVTNSVTWSNDGDPIVDARILPALKTGEYGPGYTYSQADYYHTPNVDYMADLTDGTLTATFLQAGPYHVRVSRQSGAESIYAIHAESTPLDEPRKTGGSKKIPFPDGDLFLVSTTKGKDDFIDFANAALKSHYGKDKVKEIANLDAVVEAIKESNKEHVELVGHGWDEGIHIGSDDLDAATLHDFLTKLKNNAPNLKHLSFVSCYTASTDWFLRDVADVIGKASGYTGYLEVIRGGPKGGPYIYSWMSTGGEYKVVPEPATVLMLGLGGLAMVRRRRG